MRYMLIASLLFAAVGLVGCGSNDFQATIDGEEQSFDEVQIAITEDGTRYRLTATGEQDSAKLMFVLDLDADTVRGAEVDKELGVGGAAAFAGSAQEASWTPSAANDPSVVAAWLEYYCDSCARDGSESQNLAGTLQFDEIDEDRLSGTIKVTVDGKIPYWHKDGVTDSNASLEITFDAEIEKP